MAIYKIFRCSEWDEFQKSKEFRGSQNDLQDGFIHFSTKEQIERTYNKFFSEENIVYVAEFSNESLLQKIKWEKSSSGVEYPHLYNEVLKFEDVNDFRIIQK